MCIPTYQGAAYLDECMASIAAQDLDGVEVLVSDDGSTDGSLDIVASYADRITNLRILPTEGRLGAVANVNRCIEAARGRWIKPVFQDDTIEPGCLQVMRAARRRGVPLVICARNYLYEEGVPDWRRDACDHLLDQAIDQRFGPGVVSAASVADVIVELTAKRMPQLNFLGEPVAVMIDRKAARRAGGFDTDYVQLWDYELPLRLAMKGGIVVVGDRLANFRVHEDSETARNLSGSAFGINVMDRLKLHVAYAAGPAYHPTRVAAARHDPPIDLTALAVGMATAARQLVEELPADEQAPAAAFVHDVAGFLPTSLPQPSVAASMANDAALALLYELSVKPREEISSGLLDPEPVPAPAPEPAPAEPVAPDAPDAPDAPIEPVEEPLDVPSPAGGRLRALGKVAGALRTGQWWGHMLGPIVAFAYLQLGWRDVDPGEGIIRVVALLASAIALAGYGYVVNDACDVVPDRLAGKSNAMANRPLVVRLVIIAAFAALGALPWVWIDLGTQALVALAGIYLVPVLYSAPPVRLKERHLLGPIADASNAFALPALFTIGLFAPLGDAGGPPALMVVGALAWAYGFGLRAIVIHQVMDAANDRASGTITLVARIGEQRAAWAMRSILFPVELVGLALLTVTVATWSWGAVVVGVGWAVLFNTARLRGWIERGLATTTLDKGWFMYWYQIWPALLLAAALTVRDPWYALLLVLVAVLFWSRVRSGFTIFVRESQRELRAHRARS